MKVKDHFLSQEEFILHETEYPGIWKTSPIPTDLEPYYESKNYISHHQDSGSLKEFVYKFLQTFNLLYKKNILVEHVGKGSKVLDYGCGAGEFLKKIENEFTTAGFEPNPKARSYAARKLQRTTLVGNLEEIEDGTLDAITLWHVFEHIENQQEMLDLFYRKLKPNGKLILAVPNVTSHDAQYYKNHWAAYDVPRHIYHFSKKGMLAFMNTQRWSVQKTRPLLLDAFYISILSAKYQKRPLFWLSGTFRGLISNVKALKTAEFSSIIYIIEKR